MIPLAPSALRNALPARDEPLTSLEHRARLERLRETMPHTITFRESRFDGSCMTYVLGLDTIDAYRRVALAFEPPVFAGKAFAHWLIEQIDEVQTPTLGSLTFYFEGDDWVHVGAVDDMEGRRIVSKWGEMAVFEHDLNEVPVGYGDHVRFFEKPTTEAALALFLDYARSVTPAGEVDDVLR